MISKTVLLPLAMAFGSAGISYASLIVDTTPGTNSTYSDPTPGDQISILNGPVVSGFQTTEIVSLLNGSTFEFANKVNLIVNDNGGGDTFTLNISTPATNLADLTINGGNGADTFAVTPSAAIPFTIVGGGNPQAAPGNVLIVDLTGLTGATLTDTNSAAGFSGAWTFANAQSVAFTGIETLQPNQTAPEPGALPLVAAALAGLLVARARRTKRAN
jgi:hypothetical protein